MQRFERAHALLTSRLNSLDSLLTIVNLSIEADLLDVQLYDIKRSRDTTNDRNISNLRRQSRNR